LPYRQAARKQLSFVAPLILQIISFLFIEGCCALFKAQSAAIRTSTDRGLFYFWKTVFIKKKGRACAVFFMQVTALLPEMPLTARLAVSDLPFFEQRRKSARHPLWA